MPWNTPGRHLRRWWCWCRQHRILRRRRFRPNQDWSIYHDLITNSQATDFVSELHYISIHWQCGSWKVCPRRSLNVFSLIWQKYRDSLPSFHHLHSVFGKTARSQSGAHLWVRPSVPPSDKSWIRPRFPNALPRTFMSQLKWTRSVKSVNHLKSTKCEKSSLNSALHWIVSITYLTILRWTDLNKKKNRRSISKKIQTGKNSIDLWL